MCDYGVFVFLCLTKPSKFIHVVIRLSNGWIHFHSIHASHYVHPHLDCFHILFWICWMNTGSLLNVFFFQHTDLFGYVSQSRISGVHGSLVPMPWEASALLSIMTRPLTFPPTVLRASLFFPLPPTPILVCLITTVLTGMKCCIFWVLTCIFLRLMMLNSLSHTCCPVVCFLCKSIS